MRKLSLFTSAIVVVATTLVAKEKPIMPLAVINTTYAFVTTYDGDAFNPGLTPEDRQAVLDVQQAIEKWGRYKLVYRPSEAELILVVRTGRAVQATVGFEKSTRGPDTAGSSAQMIAAETGDPEDTLDVYVASQDLKNALPLWRDRATNGLRAPELRLLKDFQSKVEASAKNAKKKP